MSEFLDAVVAWPSLLLVIVVFGFAPGFCLRLIVLAFPSADPRRTELIAELYAVPRIERPFWVAEQLEVALFEGFPHRWSAVLSWFARRHQARARVDMRRGPPRELRHSEFVGLIMGWIAGGVLSVIVSVIVIVGSLMGGFAGVIMIVIVVWLMIGLAGVIMNRIVKGWRSRDPKPKDY